MIDLLRHSIVGITFVMLLELAVIGRILLRPHRDPASRIAWVVVVGVLPLLGMFAFLLLGEVNIGRRRAERPLSRRSCCDRCWPARAAHQRQLPGC